MTKIRVIKELDVPDGKLCYKLDEEYQCDFYDDNREICSVFGKPIKRCLFGQYNEYAKKCSACLAARKKVKEEK